MCSVSSNPKLQLQQEVTETLTPLRESTITEGMQSNQARHVKQMTFKGTNYLIQTMELFTETVSGGMSSPPSKFHPLFTNKM